MRVLWLQEHAFKLARPNEKYRFEFTTSSKTIKDRLGVKSD